MFNKIIAKIKFGLMKTRSLEDVNASEEFEKKKIEDKPEWSIIVKNVIFIGKGIPTPLEKCLLMKKLTLGIPIIHDYL